MGNYVIITKQDGMIEYYSDSPAYIFDRFFECAHIFHSLNDAKRAWNSIGTFARFRCSIMEIAFVPVKKVPRC